MGARQRLRVGRGDARGLAPRARRARKRVTFDDGENERENERDVSTADAGRENPTTSDG